MMLSKIKKFYKLPLSRKIEILELYYRLFVTQVLYKKAFSGLGKKSIIKKSLLITHEYISLGKNVVIGHHARIEGTAFWHGKSFEPALTIGDGVIFQQRCHITFAGNLIIGTNTFAAHDVMITDIDHGYNKLGHEMAKQDLIINETEIGENCFIGAGVKIMAGTKLGKQCVVGANAVVRGVFPDYSVIAGVPAKVIKVYGGAKDIS